MKRPKYSYTPPPSRMATIIRLIQEELVDLHGERGRLSERIRQHEEAIRVIQERLEAIKQSNPDAVAELEKQNVKE